MRALRGAVAATGRLPQGRQFGDYNWITADRLKGWQCRPWRRGLTWADCVQRAGSRSVLAPGRRVLNPGGWSLNAYSAPRTKIRKLPERNAAVAALRAH